MIDYILSKLQYLFMFFPILFCLIFQFSYLGAENPISLSFSELQTIKIENNRYVSLRGFLYKNEQGEWILASQPNLKSCCLGTSHKAKEQIAVSFESLPSLPSKGQAITLEGFLVYAAPSDPHGQEKALYRLEKAQLKLP